MAAGGPALPISRLPRRTRKWAPPSGSFVVLRGTLLGASLLAGTLPLFGAPAPVLPPLSGELSGEVTSLQIPGLPPLRWQVILRAGSGAGTRIAELTANAPGLRARAEVQLTAFGEGTWRLLEGEVDAARWFALLAPKFFPALVDAVVTGTLAVSGEGTLHEGKLTGRTQLELRDGAIRDSASTWSVTGVALRGALQQLPALVSDEPFKFSFIAATVAGLDIRDGAIELSIDGNGQVQVARATAAMLDGHVEVTPFAFSLAKPELKSDVHFTAIEIERLAAFLPPVLADATGKVSGRMAVSWSAAAGLSPGSGRLQIDPGAAATLRLAPKPGFLTSRVPERLSLLPKSLGPLARMFSPINPAYETLRAIEMGEMRLEVNALDVGLRPDGDSEGRTARVVMTARPAAKNTAVESVRFEVNVSGPLADLVRMGLEGKIQVRAK